MKKIVSFFKHIDFIIIDLLSMFLSFVLANLIYLHSLSYYSNEIYRSIATTFVLSMLLSIILFEPFSNILRRSNVDELKSITSYSVYSLIVTIILLYVVKFSGVYSRVTIVLTYTIYVGISLGLRTLWKHYLLNNSKQFHKMVKSILIISNTNSINEILDNINKEKYLQYDIKGICLVDKDKVNVKVGNYKTTCKKNDIYKYAKDNNISEVLFAIPSASVDHDIVSSLLEEGISVHLRTEDIYGFNTDVEKIDNIGIFNTYVVSNFSFSSAQIIYSFFKRVFDIAISLIGLLFMCIVALIIKLINRKNKDGGSIFYKHLRVKKNGEEFYVYKFRTMVENADEELKKLLKNKKYKAEWEEYHKLTNDPRITKLGKVLRKTSLDELPQFINVLLGDMSLVGPRPLAKDELKAHNGLRLYEKVKPGITGWWACNGRSNITYKERLELEYYYVRNFSFGLDILTLLRTVYCVIKKVGAK